TVLARAGNDMVVVDATAGQAWKAVLDGQDGNDVLVGGAQADTLRGGPRQRGAGGRLGRRRPGRRRRQRPAARRRRRRPARWRPRPGHACGRGGGEQRAGVTKTAFDAGPVAKVEATEAKTPGLCCFRHFHLAGMKIPRQGLDGGAGGANYRSWAVYFVL